MNCIILAAGRNTRLDTGKPKSLVVLNNESLLSRHLRILKKAGVKRFCIISGYGAESLERQIPILKELHDVEIEIYHNDRYDLENGFSVFKAKEWADHHGIQEFFLTMGDHIFNLDFVKEFSQKSEKSEISLQLAVDVPGDSNKHIDLEDVTKVQISHDSLIENIGKHLTTYSHFDTGLFRLKSSVFDVFQKSFDKEKYTISDSVLELVKSKQALAIPVVGYTWNDVDNPADLKSTIQLIIESKL